MFKPGDLVLVSVPENDWFHRHYGNIPLEVKDCGVDDWITIWYPVTQGVPTRTYFSITTDRVRPYKITIEYATKRLEELI